VCCILSALLLIGPRLATLIWWLMSPAYFSEVFDTFIVPLLGLIFLPWTTLMYLVVFPNGLSPFEWILLGFAVVVDITSYSGSAYGNRDRFPSY
jgi:hypothetical protein